jgi:heme oxygenase
LLPSTFLAVARCHVQLLSRLDLATRQWHGQVDAPWYDLLRPDVTRADYIAVLFRTFGFVAPLESACKYTPGLERLIDTRPFTRAGLLAQDLLALGVSPARLATAPQCGSIIVFKEVAEALGWLYVVQRLAVVQEGIRQHLLSRVRGIDGACDYLAVLDGQAREHGAAFAGMMDRYGARLDVANEIVTAAIAGFSCATGWTEAAVGDLEIDSQRNAV